MPSLILISLHVHVYEVSNPNKIMNTEKLPFQLSVCPLSQSETKRNPMVEELYKVNSILRLS